MADHPEGVPPAPTPAGRPGLVSAAGILLIIVGVLGLINALVLLFAGRGAALTVGGIIGLVVAAVVVWAGVQVLNLKERGRLVGLILAIVDAVFALLVIAAVPVLSIIRLVIDGVIIYALTQYRQYFTA